MVGRLSKWSLVLNGIIGRSRCFGCGGWKKRRRWEITNIRAANIWTITARTTREVIWLMTMFILEPEKTYQSCRGGNFWHSYHYYLVSISLFIGNESLNLSPPSRSTLSTNSIKSQTLSGLPILITLLLLFSCFSFLFRFFPFF